MLRMMRPALPIILGLLVTLVFAVALLHNHRGKDLATTQQELNYVANLHVAAIENFLQTQIELLQSIPVPCAANLNEAESSLIPKLEVMRTQSAFTTALVANRTGKILAGAPLVNAAGKPYYWRDLSVADREYLLAPLQKGKPFISSVFQGRGFGSDILVAVSVPYFCNDQADGVVEGSLLLQEVSDILLAGDTESELVLLDQFDQVVAHVSNTPMRTLTSLARSPLALDHRLLEPGQLFETRMTESAPVSNAVKASVMGYWDLVVLEKPRMLRAKIWAADAIAILLSGLIGLAAFAIAREFFAPHDVHV